MGDKDIKIIIDIPPLTKLIEVTSRGIGMLYEPKHIKKMADAKVYEVKVIGKASLSIDVPIAYDDGKVQLNTSDYEDLAKRAGNRLAFEQMQKQQNIESVLGKTYLELENETSVNDEPVSTDWALRAFKSFEDISDEYIQTLWAKILAREIKKPKSVSLRTLEVVRNISSDEARLFEKMGHILHYVGFYSNRSVKNDIDVLKDCGLIVSNSETLETYESNEIHHRPIVGTKYYFNAVLKGYDRGIIIDLYTAILTKAGKELYKALNIPFNYEYCCNYLEQLNLDQDKFKLSFDE